MVCAFVYVHDATAAAALHLLSLIGRSTNQLLTRTIGMLRHVLWTFLLRDGDETVNTIHVKKSRPVAIKWFMINNVNQILLYYDVLIACTSSLCV